MTTATFDCRPTHPTLYSLSVLIYTVGTSVRMGGWYSVFPYFHFYFYFSCLFRCLRFDFYYFFLFRATNERTKLCASLCSCRMDVVFFFHLFLFPFMLCARRIQIRMIHFIIIYLCNVMLCIHIK